MKQNVEDNNGEPRFFHVWKDEVIQKYHRPNGRAQTEGCGRWQIKTSKWKDPTKAPNGLMATCKYGCKGNGGKGPRKVRLNPKTRKFYTFESKEAALMFLDAMERHQEVEA